MKTMRALAAVAVAAAVAGGATLLAGPGNGAPSGSHYSLNIIGTKNKTATMTGSNRHTIFVALNNRNSVEKSKIYLVPGEDFQVCDGNAFDTAYGCNGEDLPRIAEGAVFMLPCNTNLTPGEDPDGETSTLYGCDEEDPQLAYEVYARALGKPGGDAIVTTCATEVVDVNNDGVLEEVCSTENVVLIRDPSKSTFSNVTQELTSLVVCFDTDPTVDEDIDCFRYALFRDELQDWFWEYDNNGLRLAQLRFYPI